MFSDYLDLEIGEKFGTSAKKNLIVHANELPAYRFVDLYYAVEEFVKKLENVHVFATEHSESLSELIHVKEPDWADRRINKSIKVSWPTGPDDEQYLPRDCFWLCPSENSEECFIIRLTFNYLQKKSNLELACCDGSAGENAINQITRHSAEHSIYRNRIIRLAYETGKKDEYGDVEKAEELQVVFSSIGTVSGADIVLSKEHHDLIQRNIIDLQVRREILRANGVPTSRGVLFHGPPGTGKTFACRYICHQLKDTTCIFVAGAALMNVGAVFSLTRFLQPSILFIEDADLMFSSRDNNLYSTTLGELMDQMDGLRLQENISVVLTTNDIDRLEAALKDRPGRISQCIYMGAPNDDLRLRYIQHQLAAYELDDLDLNTLVKKTDGATQAFIKEWVHRSVQIACERLDKRTQKVRLVNSDFSVAMKEMQRFLDVSGGNIIGFTGRKNR